MKKILVIEDEKSVRENINTFLSEEGYNVFTAPDGESGINIAKTELPDLIVCDIMMNGLDGYSVLKEISKNKSTRIIPFIFLTAKVDLSDLRLGMELGADDYLFKPFKLDALLRSIESRINKAEMYKTEISLIDEKNEHEKYLAADKIFISINGKPQLIAIKDIIFITAENQYTSLNLVGSKSFLIRKSVGSWEKILPEKNFLRIHRSAIINTDYLQKIEKSFNSSFMVRLQHVSEPFLISKRYASKLRSKLI